MTKKLSADEKNARKEILENRWLERCQIAAKSAGGQCLGKVDNGRLSKAKYRFRCKENHEWVSTPASVVHAKSWCPICAGNKQRTLKEAQDLAKSRGGKCLTTEYLGVDGTYTWQCSLGHQWKNIFKKIEQGQWCPICAKSGVSEEVCRTTFEQIFGEPFRKARPRWLRNDRERQMEIDGFNKDLKIGFEYQGRQHFEYVSHLHKDKSDVSQRIIDDQCKAQLCAEHGIHLFIIDYKTEYADFPKEIKKQAGIMGMDISNLNLNEKINLARAYVREDRLEEIRELVENKDGQLLSKKWLGVKHKYKVRCNKDAHTWKVVGSELIAGAWCKMCAMRELHNKQKLDMQALVEYAAEFGGEVLSNTYTKRNALYKFRCLKGHEFEGNFNNMMYRRQFCPICEERQLRGKYPPYEKIEPLVHKLNIKTVAQWKEYVNGDLKGYGEKPPEIPKDPAKVYKGKGWRGWGKWLGTDAIANQNKVFLPFEEARQFARELGFKSQTDWRIFAKDSGKLPSDIPASPYSVYKGKGWVSWPDWLGTSRGQYKKS